MKVLFISRSTLYTLRGGDTTQVDSTAAALRKLGVQVDIRLAGAVESLEGYDLVHFFNIIRPADILAYARQLSVPYVVSSIFVDYSLYDRQERQGLGGALARVFTSSQLEYAKALGRVCLGQDKLVSKTYLLGHRRAMRWIAKNAALVLPNSENEAKRLQVYLGQGFPYRVVPNAVSPELFYPLPGVARDPRRVISVGQVEGRKNQHRLIEATRDMDVELVIIGRASPNNTRYYDHCRAIAHNRVRFIDFVPQPELNEWYNSAGVHALPSWFETTGLSSLEAAAAGCRLVVSEAGDTRDYFTGRANFCQPGDVSSIRQALSMALSSDGHGAAFRDVILEKYTWDRAARQTLDAYQHVLMS